MAEKEKRVGNTVRKENSVRSFKRSMTFVVVLFLVVIAAFAGLKIAEKTSVETLSSENSSGGAYPVSFSTNDIKDVKKAGNNLVVLTKKFATVLSKGGNILSETSVVYGDSAVCTKDNDILVFDRLSNKYVIIDKKGNTTERKTSLSNKIYNAKITDDGRVLLSLKSDSSSSLVSVTDKKGNDKFVWSCTQEYIADMGVSDNGKTLYLAGISAEGGEMYTMVYAVNMKKGTEKSYKIPSEALIALNEISSDKFNVLTNEGIYIFDSSKDEMLINSISFDSELLYWSADEKGNVAVVTHNAGNLAEDMLRVYSANGAEEYSVSLQSGIQDLCIDKDEAYLLYQDCVVAVKNGKVDDKLTFENKTVGLCKNGRQLYCYSLGGVEKAKG